MMIKLIKRFRNMTMKGQITVLNIIFILLVISVGWIDYYAQTQIYNYIASSSITQILQYQDQSQIAIITQNLGSIIEIKLAKILYQMNQLNDYFLFYAKNQEKIILNPSIDFCLSFEELMIHNTSFYTPKFCYQAIGVSDYKTLPQNESNLQVLNNFISFLNPFSIIIDVSFTGFIQIAAISSTKYFAQFPFAALLPWFDITALPWYQNHLYQINNNHTNQRFVFSPLNDFFITTFKEMSITMSFIYKDQPIGILRQGLLVTIFLIPKIPYNVFLIDSDGLVVYYNMEQIENITNQYFYIYDQNKTGLNETDWKQIIDFSTQINKSIIILENKLQNQTINCYSTNVLKNNFTLIVFTNISTKNQYEDQSQIIKQQTFQLFSQIAFFQIILGFVAVIIQVLVIIIVFRPLEQFNKLIKTHILSIGNNVQSEIFKLKHQRTKNDSLSNLQNQLLNFSKTLEQGRSKKSDQCRLWESFTYDRQKHIKCSSIKKLTSFLQDNSELELKIDKLLYIQLIKGLN